MHALWSILLSFLLFQTTFGQTTPNPALLVGEKSGAMLAIVDPASMTIVAQVPANEHPHEVATHGQYAYVSNSGAKKITVIDLKAQEQVAGIELSPMSAIHSLVMADGKLYFAHEASRAISRYDPATKTIDQVLGTGIPSMHMIAVPGNGTMMFGTSMSAGVAAIIENVPSRGWEITKIPTGPRAEGLDVSPDGRELWVTNVNDSTISVIDIASKKEIDSIEMPTTFSNRVKFTLDGRYAFLPDLRGDHVIVLDARTRAEVKRIDVGGGSEGLLMTPDGTRAFIAVSRANKVVAVDLSTLEIVGDIPGLINPDGMAWAESR